MLVLVRILVRLLQVLLVPTGGLVVAWIVTMRESDPHLFPVIDGKAVVEIAIADHGVHAGIIFKRSDIEEIALKTGAPVLLALANRFAAYSYLEVGWGDEQFYRFAPTLSSVTVSMAFHALAGLDTGTVLHVVGLQADAGTTFPHSDVQTIRLSTAGFERLVTRFAASFAVNGVGDPIELGPGIYGPSLFYRATGQYSLLQTCNRWLSDLLHEAGLASSPIPATLSIGLMEELRLRNQL